MERTLLTGKPLIIILGATATGKTALAIEAALRLNGEIISADSRQVYREMDIGTAKATPDQRQQVPHYLIDIVNPDETLGVAEYQAFAYQTIDAIHARAKLPLLVGGTGQYITAVAEGWSIPQVPPNPTLRAQLELEAQQQGAPVLHARLAQIDPQSALTIHPNNARRVIRALEVYIESGTPFSVLQRKQPPPYRMLTIGLQMSRDVLYERADKRVDTMMADGFRDEVKNLLAKRYPRNLPAMSGVGYLELAAHLQDGLSLEEAVQQTKNSTHNFIRRQEIWFRGHDNGILWHNVDQPDFDSIIGMMTHWLHQE
jgi:tRNA dimethylallyltransferase